MPTDFGIDYDDDEEVKNPLGSKLTTVLKDPEPVPPEPVPEDIKELSDDIEKEKPVVERDIKSEIRSLLSLADKHITRSNHKELHLSITKVIKLLEEL